jgi:hypothetical protein
MEFKKPGRTRIYAHRRKLKLIMNKSFVLESLSSNSITTKKKVPSTIFRETIIASLKHFTKGTLTTKIIS